MNAQNKRKTNLKKRASTNLPENEMKRKHQQITQWIYIYTL